jgi:23S rRNA pseudouridine1911/1915/1917 synthase
VTISALVDSEAPQRADQYLAAIPGGPTRSKLKSGVQSVLINGIPAKLSAKVKHGDEVSASWEETVPVAFLPEDIPLDIIYEDGDVTVVNKPQGIVTHPAPGNWSGTLVNALLYRWGRGAIPHGGDTVETRPGIVHRLDKDTSGVIVTARNPAAEAWLKRQFFERRVKKEYVAIAAGRPPQAKGNIRSRLVRDERNRKLFKSVALDAPAGKAAHTVYRCVACYGPFSLLRLRLKTGRTHQIRAHLKALGCPVLGDPLYGARNKCFPDALLMLHSRLLSVRLPEREAFSNFAAPVPDRFKHILKTLHESYQKCLPT